MRNTIASDRLKIAWVSPLAQTSAIGRYSRIVVSELAKYHDIEAWTFGNFRLHDMPVPVRIMRDHREAAGAAEKIDVAVYQVGNHWPFHGEILLTARSRPGIVVLHDYTIQHLVAAYCFDYLQDPKTYIRFMRESHGETAEREARAACSGLRPPVWDTDEAVEYPLTSVVTANAIGVVTHSKYALGGVRNQQESPAAVLPLPYEAPAVSARSCEDLDLAADRLLVVTTGHMNPNKRVREVVAALGALPERLKARVIYALAGPIGDGYAAEVKAAASAAGLDGRVRLEGYVTDARLQAYVERADVCVNLRYPNYEGASASVIEQLLAGKAVVASSTGSFAELPADTVQHVQSDWELSGVLERLLSDRDLRERLGTRARVYAERTFRADAYAAGFSNFAISAVQEAPLRCLDLAMTGHARRFGIAADNPWMRSVKKRIQGTFLTSCDESGEYDESDRVITSSGDLHDQSLTAPCRRTRQ